MYLANVYEVFKDQEGDYLIAKVFYPFTLQRVCRGQKSGYINQLF